MKSTFFDFYKTMYIMRYLEKTEVKTAADWGVITTEEYQEITGEVYVQ